jgi:hypothetical protein
MRGSMHLLWLFFQGFLGDDEGLGAVDARIDALVLVRRLGGCRLACLTMRGSCKGLLWRF